MKIKKTAEKPLKIAKIPLKVSLIAGYYYEPAPFPNTELILFLIFFSYLDQ